MSPSTERSNCIGCIGDAKRQRSSCVWKIRGVKTTPGFFAQRASTLLTEIVLRAVLVAFSAYGDHLSTCWTEPTMQALGVKAQL
jgi:hypothetical protein